MAHFHQSRRKTNMYTQDELESLQDLAVDYVKRDGGNDFGKHICDVFYRNKPPQYFKKCQKEDNIMRVYRKDYNGDPKSAINGCIEGLFFATGVDKHGQLPDRSPFGSKRVSIPSTAMLTRNSNLYFADFYCKCDSDPHYVTLVLTEPGSKTDCYCKKKLTSLETGDNDFLWRSKKKVYVTSKVLVEVLYTQDVDLSRRDCAFTRVDSKGTSTPGGLLKNPNCPVCNIGSIDAVTARFSGLRP